MEFAHFATAPGRPFSHLWLHRFKVSEESDVHFPVPNETDAQAYVSRVAPIGAKGTSEAERRCGAGISVHGHHVVPGLR